MALVVYDRVQETTTTSGTGSVTLLGAVGGFQSFAVVGNGNTTYYTITDGVQWEVGIGTYSTSGPTLARTTILSNSNGNTSPITLSGGLAQVFVTYTAEKSVNLDASNNVTPLGTIASGTWQGTTIGVSYGGTGVTASSGVNSVMLRDSNANTLINNITQGWTSTVSAGGTTTLTAASTYWQRLTGTTTQTFKLPDATTLNSGASYIFDNDSSANLFIVDDASGAVDTVAPGGYTTVFLESTSTAAGEWGRFGMLPTEVNWGTLSADLGNTTITNATWNGTTIGTGYGGTGLTSFTSGGALYATSTSALTSGTLPASAGGTGNASYTTGDLLYASGTTTLSKLGIGTNGYVLTSSGTGPQWTAATSVGVTSISFGSTGLTPSTATQGAVTVAGTLGVGYGGTGQTTYTDGQLLIGNSTGNTLTKATLTPGTGISITNGGGSISIASTVTSGVTVTNDTSTATALYPTFTSATSGSITGVSVTSTKLNFTPSTGLLSAPELAASNGLVLNSKTVSTSYTIPAGYNATATGPITIASGVAVTLPTGSRWVIL